MESTWISVTGVLIPGHGIASGRSTTSPYPGGSIALQLPCFKALGLDLSDCWLGTLNVDIAPYQFVIKAPAYQFRQVKWTPHHPPEDFSFSRCQVRFRDCVYAAWVYYPHPETKRQHFQAPSTVEVLSPKIPAIEVGDRLELCLNATEIWLQCAAP